MSKTSPIIFSTLAGSLFTITTLPTAGQTAVVNAAGTAWALRNVAIIDVSNTFAVAQVIQGDLTLSPDGTTPRTLRIGGYGSPYLVTYDGGNGGRYGAGVRPDENQVFIPSSAKHSWRGGGDLQTGTNNEWMALTSSRFLVNVAQVDFANLPTSDPHVAGRIWRSANDIKISTG